MLLSITVETSIPMRMGCPGSRRRSPVTTMNQERMLNPFLVQVVHTALRWPIGPGMRKKWMMCCHCQRVSVEYWMHQWIRGKKGLSPGLMNHRVSAFQQHTSRGKKPLSPGLQNHRMSVLQLQTWQTSRSGRSLWTLLQRRRNPSTWSSSPHKNCETNNCRTRIFAHSAEVLLQSASTWQLWLCRSQLRLKEEVLYYIWEEDKDHRWLFVVPASLRDMLMKQCHDSPFGGHLGREKTLSALRRHFLWYGKATDVKLYVSTCRECHLGKHPNKKPRASLQNYQAGCPGDCVHQDILEPFCESEAGNRYVLMIVDQFSHWLEMVPLTIQDAESIARAFFEICVIRFGAPFVMHMDQGRNFDSTMMK